MRKWGIRPTRRSSLRSGVPAPLGLTAKGTFYAVESGKKVGFQARSVVGGVFLEMLYHGDCWKKYAGRDKLQPAGWAPLPPPRVTTAPN